jgi:hypothetical protein
MIWMRVGFLVALTGITLGGLPAPPYSAKPNSGRKVNQ